jgi:CRP/FNR family transcriptional regulator, nitrogen oxide reductase regulator
MVARAPRVQQFPLFSNVSLADCREIVSTAHERAFSRRETIFLEGDPIRNIILLTSGSAKVMQFGQNGSEVILSLSGPGEIVGMAGFYAQDHYRSMARALSASTALVWNTSLFERLSEHFPALRRNIARMFWDRLREMEERYREVSTEKVAARLSHQLLRLFDQVGRRVNGAIEIKLSREELAQLTGTTLFTVSRLLSDWDQRGMITTGRESVTVQDVNALRQFAERE